MQKKPQPESGNKLLANGSFLQACNMIYGQTSSNRDDVYHKREAPVTY